VKHKLPDTTANDARHPTETDKKTSMSRVVSRIQQFPQSQEPAREPADSLERFAPLPCVLPDDEW
jgi:hypothetical protein